MMMPVSSSPPIRSASSQSLTAPNIFPNVCVKLLICLTPGQPLLRGHADGVMISDEIEHLIYSAVQRQIVGVHEQEDYVLKLRDPLW